MPGLPGLATHYGPQAGRRKRPACGTFAPDERITEHVGGVNCLSCRRTKAWRSDREEALKLDEARRKAADAVDGLGPT